MSSIENPIRSSKDLRYPPYMVFCAISASLGNLCQGWVIGSPNLPGKITHDCEYGMQHHNYPSFPDCLPMSEALWGFAVASFCLGSLVGALIGGPIRTRFGGRLTTIYNSFGYIFGGLLIGCAMNPAMFIVGRIISGISCGITSLATPIYVGEITTVPVRGALSTVYQLSTTLGCLLAAVIGLPLSTVPLWRLQYALVALPALVTLICMPLCVESPRYLVTMNRLQEAESSLQKLRPNSDITAELNDILEAQLGSISQQENSDYFKSHGNINSAKVLSEPFEPSTPPPRTPPPQYQENYIPSTQKQSMNLLQVLQDPSIRPTVLLIIFINVMQQLSGINAVIYYSTTMFNELFDANMSKYLSIVVNVINFLSTAASLVLIDRMGRRTVILSSLIGLTLFSLLLSLGYIFSLGPLMVTSIFCFVLMFAFGMGPIPWMITSELVPANASSSTGALSGAMNWSTNFLIGQCFPLVFSAIHGYSFLMFTGFGVLATVVVFFKLPETKGRSIEDILNEINK